MYTSVEGGETTPEVEVEEREDEQQEEEYDVVAIELPVLDDTLNCLSPPN